jgi:DNA-directed RNA polymerase specialized sigma24 family protein
LLEILAKKDKYWREIAFKICKDRYLADDLVQEMYLRFLRHPKEKVNDFYVCLVIKSLFLNYKKTETQNLCIDNFYNIQENNDTFEPTDYELSLIKACEKLPYPQDLLMQENYDLSIRELEKKYPHINYGLIYRELKKARENILGIDIDLYKNKRIKNVKKTK